MPNYRYAPKLRFIAIILLISLAFSSLLPGGVTTVYAQSPETATPEAVTAATATATMTATITDPPTEAPPDPTQTAAPTGTPAPETASRWRSVRMVSMACLRA